MERPACSRASFWSPESSVNRDGYGYVVLRRSLSALRGSRTLADTGHRVPLGTRWWLCRQPGTRSCVATEVENRTRTQRHPVVEPPEARLATQWGTMLGGIVVNTWSCPGLPA